MASAYFASIAFHPPALSLRKTVVQLFSKCLIARKFVPDIMLINLKDNVLVLLMNYTLFST
jgi:hypothetical protein